MRRVALVLLVLLVAAPLAMAKEKAKTADDTTMSVGPFLQTLYNTGITEEWGAGGGIKFQYWFINSLAIEARVSVLRGVEDDVEDDIDQGNIIPLEAGLVFRPPLKSPVLPYLGLGGGYYYLDTDASDVDSPFGIFGLGGVDFILGKHVKIFLEVKYTYAVEEREYEYSFFGSSYSYKYSYGLDGPGGVVGVAFNF